MDLPMADSSENLAQSPGTTSPDSVPVVESVEIDAPLPKKRRCFEMREDKNLEKKLHSILACSVCLDLPPAQVYQCVNGHLMCSSCFTHLLADARLKDEPATCPNCRVDIRKENCQRNLVAEKAVSELPALCMYCNVQLARVNLPNHELNLCQDRPSRCQYQYIGCDWAGPNREMKSHEKTCKFPSMEGREILPILERANESKDADHKYLKRVIASLSLEKISISDLQLRTYRTDEIHSRVFWESSRFSALNNQWVLKARVEAPIRDPTQTCNRVICIQLVLKSRILAPLDVQYMMLPGPCAECSLQPRLVLAEFNADVSESAYRLVPLQDGHQFNRLLAQRIINLRLFMIQAVVQK